LNLFKEATKETEQFPATLETDGLRPVIAPNLSTNLLPPMTLQTIPFDRFASKVFHLFDEQWLVLTAGDFAQGKFNAMTISWGSLGIIWGRPFVQVVVRPTRHTHGFMERFGTFTVTAYPESCRRALNVLGSKSGRDGDKIAEAGLTPVASTQVAAPAFAEAELVLECRKLYHSPLDPRHFLDPAIESNYPKKDYHTVYFGEIVAIRGVAKYAGS
jgi:flavin reductase (DIM6/NTAB) family NADH-FMN oxidoreductase RutF